MPIPIQCSECDFKSQVKDELAGKKLKCPKCQAVITVKTAVKKPAASESPTGDPSQNLMKVNLAAYKDVIPDEEEEEEEPEEPQPKHKLKKGSAPPAELSSGVKMAVALSVLASLAIIAALVMYVGPQLKLGESDERPAGQSAPANEGAPAEAPAN